MSTDFNPLEAIGFWAFRTASALRLILERRLQEVGICSLEAFILMMISLRGPQTLAHLTKLSAFTHPLVLRNIDSLEARGYIKRKPHGEDRRIKMLHMTAAGEKLMPEIRKRLGEVNGLARRGLSEAEVENLIVTLQRVFLNAEPDDEELVKCASASIAGRKKSQGNLDI